MLTSPKVKRLVVRIVFMRQGWDELEDHYRALLPALSIDPNVPVNADEKALFRELREELATSFRHNIVDADVDSFIEECRHELLKQEQNAIKSREQERLVKEAVRLAKEKFELERREAFKQLKETLEFDFLKADIFYEEFWEKYVGADAYTQNKAAFIKL